MPLVKAQCTNCGQIVTVDNSKDAAICEYCGTPYIVEKAINYYNMTVSNVINVENVNIYGGNSADFVIRAGVLIKYNGASVDVTVPDTVSYIGDYAFAGCTGLRRVALPDTIKEIRECAFEGCRELGEINLPEGIMNIKGGAFKGCESLSQATLPKSLKFKDGEADYSSYGIFEESGVEEINIPGSIGIIPAKMFINCRKLKKAAIGKGVARIGANAFCGCTALADVFIPDGVKIICDSAFAGSGLTEVELPYSVTNVCHRAFNGCKRLRRVFIPDDVDVDSTAFHECDSVSELGASFLAAREYKDLFQYRVKRVALPERCCKKR